MQNYIVALFLFISQMAIAQQSPVYFFNRNDLPKNALGIGVSYQSTISTGISYTRICAAKNRNIALQAEIGSPVILLKDRSKDFHLNGSTYLFHSRLNVKALAGLSFKTYNDVLSEGEALFYNLGVYPGIYNEHFFIAAECAYRNNIFTTFRFKEIYPEVDNTTLYNVSGTLTCGVNTGFMVKEKVEMNARLFYFIYRNLQNYSPFTQNIGASLGVNYRL